MADNIIASSIDLVIQKAEAAGKPVFTERSDEVERGCLISLGVDYFDVGKQAAPMAKKILDGEKTENIRYQYAKADQMIVNKSVATKLGIDISKFKDAIFVE
jgi:putative ABC transport system substrate-binding protein